MAGDSTELAATAPTDSASQRVGLATLNVDIDMTVNVDILL